MAGASGLMLAMWQTSPIVAADLYSEGGSTLRWDNTVSYATMFRLKDPDPVLLADRNRDDGNRNFATGPVGSRFDLLSQLDFTRSWFGAHVSGAAWYDTIYQQRNDNDSPDTFNPASVPNTDFPDAVRRLHGSEAELLNAFVYANAELGGVPFTIRAGRHTLLWGESLFFPENSIAAGQAPVDVTKVLGRPVAYSSDAFLPVTQASASVQLPRNLTVEAYYQFEWRRTRLPGAGSYFSVRDYYDAGGERFFLRSGHFQFRERDLTPPGSGQYGAALRATLGEADYGLYALRMNAKDPVAYYRSGLIPNSAGPPTIVDPSIVDLSIDKAGVYNLVYPQGIEIYGASASFYLGASTIAGEVSTRRHTPLANSLIFLEPGRQADANRNPAYPVGHSLHFLLSTITMLPRGGLWDSASFSTEIAAIKRLEITQNTSDIDPESNPFAVVLRGSFEPTYFEVMPNLDLTPSLGLTYRAGRPSVFTYQSEGAGNLDLGVTARYREAWSATVLYSRFLGNSARQPLADRDFIRFSLQRFF
jgi:Protein of unknown function (DUF1302)